MKKMLILLIFPMLLAFGSITYKASYYGSNHHGKKTSSGEIFDKNKLTCAAIAEYKFGEFLEVTNKQNNKSVIVKVNDRGNFAKYGRTLDLSEAAFKEIASVNQGVIKISIKRL